MKQNNFNRKAIYIVLAILLPSLGLLVIQQANAFSSDENTDTQSFPSPPTPDIAFLRQFERPIEALPQRSISRIVDLAKGLPSEDVFVYIVLRTDGKYEEYHIPATYTGDKQELMNLGMNDKIVTGYPLKPMLSTPVLEAPEKEMREGKPSPTGEPYPPPLNKDPDTSILQPYP